MKKNLGTVDRVLRIIAALVIGILLLRGDLSGVAATILGIVAIILLLTGAISLCPLYSLLNISTLKRREASK